MTSEHGDIISIRLIRSFEHANIRHLVVKGVNFDWTTEQLMETVRSQVKSDTSNNLPPPFKKFDYDCLKIEHHAHGAKTNDLVINTENDELLMLKPNQVLKAAGVKNETSISFFRRSDYEAYVASKNQT